MSDPLIEVAQLVQNESGLALSRSQLPALRAAIERAAPGLDAAELLATREPTHRAELMAKLLDGLTVKETYFLRHPAELDTIDWSGLLAAAERREATCVRVWNPACATGEDPYSLAMLALEALGPKAAVSILATDIARPALRRAEVGSYGARSLRHVTSPLRERHLRGAGSTLAVAPHVREMVRFKAHNLAGGPFPSGGRSIRPGGLSQRADLLRPIRDHDHPARLERLATAGRSAPAGRRRPRGDHRSSNWVHARVHERPKRAHTGPRAWPLAAYQGLLVLAAGSGCAS